MRRGYAGLLATLLLCACPAKKPDAARAEAVVRYPPAEGVPGCRLYGEPRSVGAVPLVLAEMSGLAASVQHPGVFWSHNDSGNALQVFAIEASGKVLATVTLTGGPAGGSDVEDIAVGPCTPGEARACLFLADTGDNFERQPRAHLLRLPEPERLADDTLPVDTLTFAWPDRPHDCESLVVEPGSGRLAVITKERDSLGEVFALPGLAPDRVAQAVHLGSLRAPGNADFLTTAAALHPSGQRMLLRTYTRVWELRRPGATRLEALLLGQLAEVPGPSQAQSEAITYLPDEGSPDDSHAYLIGSEFAGQRLYQVDCR
ncbi:hypothetical protein [Melittangium boletus]|uniref:hypothetical protein n=1 Tax=Melittangium boletus TaxID=83453 RepID=UPI003DA59350